MDRIETLQKIIAAAEALSELDRLAPLQNATIFCEECDDWVHVDAYGHSPICEHIAEIFRNIELEKVQTDEKVQANKMRDMAQQAIMKGFR